MLIVRADTSEMLVTLLRMAVAEVHQLTMFAILASGNLMADRGKFDSGRYATIALCAFQRGEENSLMVDFWPLSRTKTTTKCLIEWISFRSVVVAT